MSLRIEILNEQEEEITDKLQDLLVKLLNQAAEIEGVADQEVAITFVGNDHIQQINQQFRQIDQPTDVLSFPLEEDDALGDIIISVKKAKEQAQAYQHSFEREIGFLAVHGFLHLLGYDHETEQEEQVMFARQEEILQKARLIR
ncbi:rRNA maturation RNase YbeY [Ammoniphilus oxalaticus]|uniref:Endoribonuclease YbeY n=1 Tax=Ammoniphilus oxalaticus TaxID=66863 RepID=A0A419SJ59_9BACL|nr:rRNA maturation RNase YbeY [Ammoniphilus oxalaticus]RKD24007.1 rRNA maturation RNase YbeY [Ammoniphilus oxalaticus]